MANTYTWDFPQLDAAPTEGSLSDVVKTIHWRMTAISDTETNDEGAPLSVSAYGTAGVGEADADNFTAFDSLTQDWCKEKVLASLNKTEAEMQTMLDTQITNLANPPIVGKLPAGW
jgi:hypothetical protein|tara:strand:+ start:201 stop:548 length:348 start_codon:yes stop_codon:yes gene_type:complete